MDNFESIKTDCTPLNVQTLAANGEPQSLIEEAVGLITSENMDFGLRGGAPGPSTDKPEEMDIPLSQESAGMSISSEQENILLQPSPERKKTHDDRVKLSGAGRRRLKALLAKGIPLETARSMAVMPPNAPSDVQSTPKRARSDGSTPTSSSRPTKRFAPAGNKNADNPSAVPAVFPSTCNLLEGVETPTKGSSGPGEGVAVASEEQAVRGASLGVPCSEPTLAETVASRKIGIIPHDFPEGIWSSEEIAKVQKCILDRMYESRRGAVKPHFAGYSFKPGWLVLNCLDNETVAWTKEVVPTLKPWEGALLKVVDEAEVPKAAVFVGYFPSSVSWPNERILGQIESQNSDLRVSDWKVLHRLEKGELVELAIALDPSSAEKVEKLGNKVFYGFGSAQLRPRLKGARVKNDNTAKVPDDQPSTSAAARAQLSLQKPKTGPRSVKPKPKAGNGNTSAKKPSVLSGRLRKWERKNPEAAETTRSMKGGKVRKGQSGK